MATRNMISARARWSAAHAASRSRTSSTESAGALQLCDEGIGLAHGSSTEPTEAKRGAEIEATVVLPMLRSGADAVYRPPRERSKQAHKTGVFRRLKVTRPEACTPWREQGV